MASEIQFDHTTGRTCYVQVRNSVGQIWNTVGAAFEAYQTANVGDYDIPAAEQGTASGLYTASVPVIPAGVYGIVAKDRAGGSPVETDLTVGAGEIEWSGTAIISSASVIVGAGGINEAAFHADTAKYQAKVWMFDDDTGAADRYVSCFFRNGEPVTAGITGPTIQVIKVADGSDLVSTVAMVQIASTGMYRYNEGANRVLDGVAYIARVQATIGGNVRTWNQPVGRDS